MKKIVLAKKTTANVLVYKATFRKALGDWGLSTFKTTPKTGTRAGFLAIRAASRCSAVTRALASSNSLLLNMVLLETGDRINPDTNVLL